jgi:hypothetical protein
MEQQGQFIRARRWRADVLCPGLPIPLRARARSRLFPCLALGLIIFGAPGIFAQVPGGKTYPDTPDGLKRLMVEIYSATQNRDNRKADALMKALALPEPDAWFKNVFGDRKGAKLASEYRVALKTFDTELARLFAKVVREGQSEIHVRKFERAPDPQAVGLQNDAMAAMINRRPIYSVRFVKPGERLGQHVYSFVYADGAFRLVGKMQAAKG